MTRVKWASEPDVVELSDHEESSVWKPNNYGNRPLNANSNKGPLKSSLKRKPSPPTPPTSDDNSGADGGGVAATIAPSSPTPSPTQLLEWAKQQHESILFQLPRDQEWRERGRRLRERLVEKDEENGGNAFTLSNRCKIERYFEVAERVMDQFLNSNVEDKVELTESFLVGNRLVKFLAHVLPKHANYFSNEPNIWELRTKSQKQLVQLLLFLERLALVIDEDEYNKFILNDLQDKESSSSKRQDESEQKPSPVGNKTAETIDLKDFLADTEVKKDVRSSPVSGHSGKQTVDTHDVKDLFLDMRIEKTPLLSDRETSLAFSDSSFSFASWNNNNQDANGFPQESLLGQVDDDKASDILDSSFSEQLDSMLFLEDASNAKPDSGSLVSDASSLMHSSSWDDSFSQFAKLHAKPPQFIKKKNHKPRKKKKEQSTSDASLTPSSSNVFAMVDDWGDDEWTPSDAFQQPQNVFRRDDEDDDMEQPYSSRLKSFSQQPLLLKDESTSDLWNEPQQSKPKEDATKSLFIHRDTLQQLQALDEPQLLEERQQSPKSVAALPDWVSWDETSATHTHTISSALTPGGASSYFPVAEEALQPQDHVGFNDAIYDQADEETQSLTGGTVQPRGNVGPLRHIKGCVKCLLE